MMKATILRWAPPAQPGREWARARQKDKPPGQRPRTHWRSLPQPTRPIQTKQPDAVHDTPAPAPGTDTSPAGWVAFALYHYENGQIARREEHRLSQADFVNLLRYGQR